MMISDSGLLFWATLYIYYVWQDMEQIVTGGAWRLPLPAWGIGECMDTKVDTLSKTLRILTLF